MYTEKYIGIANQYLKDDFGKDHRHVLESRKLAWSLFWNMELKAFESILED